MTIESKTNQSNREVKSSAFTALFTALFSEPENAVQLYRALEGDGEIRAADIELVTLSGVLFLARKNDMAFLARKKVLMISEHQSTINANMPLRSAIYFGRTVEKLIEPKAIYRTGQILLPVPEFYTFYNGTEPFPKEKILKLSDAYLEKPDDPMLELIVRVININLLAGHPLLDTCRPMYEYSWFIEQIRMRMANGLNRHEAIMTAMSDCRTEGILNEFLRDHGTEAVNMLYTQFNLEDALEVRGEEKFAEGEARGELRGKQDAVLALLDEYGPLPEALCNFILKEDNLHKLNVLLKQAAKAVCLEDFMKMLDESAPCS